MRKVSLLVVLVLVVSFGSLAAAGTVAPGLQKQVNQTAPGEKIRVILLTRGPPDAAAVDAIERAGNAPVTKRFDVVDGVALELPAAAVDNIANLSFVEEVQQDLAVRAVLDTSVPQIRADEVHERNVTGNTVDVAVLDTGIHDEHPALTVEREQDFTGEGTDDLHGHGTHVAGIIASTDDLYRGVGYQADLYNAKVLDQDGTGTASDVIDALDWAVANDAEVISMSLGALVEECDGTDALSQAVDGAVEEGVTVVVAAGNEGPENGTITAPGCARKAITVGAVDDAGEVSDFSSRGPTADGRVKPDVVAPGDPVTSTWPGGFATLRGTSMSTPHVSGAAALLYQVDPTLSPGAVKNVTMATAEDLGYAPATEGEGLVDVLAAYEEVAGAENPPVITDPDPADGATGVNDTDDGQPVDALISVLVGDSDDTQLNVTFTVGASSVHAVVQNATRPQYEIEDLKPGVEVEWTVTASDGNATTSRTYTFTTEDAGNETGNRTRALPPGLRTKEVLPPPFRGLLPNQALVPGHPLYGLKRASETVSLALTADSERRAEKRLAFAERRLSEAVFLAERGDEERAGRLVEEYRNGLEAANRTAGELPPSARRNVSRRVAEATQRHMAVLQKVRDRVPENARPAIERAMNASSRAQAGVAAVPGAPGNRTPGERVGGPGEGKTPPNVSEQRPGPGKGPGAGEGPTEPGEPQQPEKKPGAPGTPGGQDSPGTPGEEGQGPPGAGGPSGAADGAPGNAPYGIPGLYGNPDGGNSDGGGASGSGGDSGSGGGNSGGGNGGNSGGNGGGPPAGRGP